MNAEKREWLSFDRNTISSNKNGRWQLSCVKGLWGVDAPTLEEATREAHHYFRQYYFDGEYDL